MLLLWLFGCPPTCSWGEQVEIIPATDAQSDSPSHRICQRNRAGELFCYDTRINVYTGPHQPTATQER